MSEAVSKIKKRRGTAKRSITNLENRLNELEARVDVSPANRLESARQNKAQLSAYDADFRKLHLELVDLLETTDDLDREQLALDEHEDRVTSLSIRLQCIINTYTGSTPPAPSVLPRDVFMKRMQQVEHNTTTIGG